MAIPESPLSPVFQTQVVSAIRQSTVATLTAALIAASGRPHSIKELTEIQQDLWNTMYPDPSLGQYGEWFKTKDARLAKMRE
jgi:hypothetical protein